MEPIAGLLLDGWVVQKYTGTEVQLLENQRKRDSRQTETEIRTETDAESVTECCVYRSCI